MAEVKAVTDYANVKTMDKQEAIKAGLYEQIGANIDDKYIAELKKQVIHWERLKDCLHTSSWNRKYSCKTCA